MTTEKAHNTSEKTKKKIMGMIPGSMGIMSVVASRSGVNRNTVALYAKLYPEVREALDAERENIIDLSESKLVTAINGGEAWAIALALKTLGKSRGYVEKQEVQNSGEVTVKVVYQGDNEGNND